MSKHTPGSWQRGADVRNVQAPRLMTVRDANEKVVAFTAHEDATRLIAAAPDLLEALKELADYVRTDLVDSDIARRVEAAIAKAEGTS